MEKKDRNCGLCGEMTCLDFQDAVAAQIKKETECPFYLLERQTSQMSCESEAQRIANRENGVAGSINVGNVAAECSSMENVDTHGYEYDFLLTAIGNEPSARKIVRPFRTDLIDKLDIKPGDIVVARPMGAGCPVTHVLKVYEVDELAGLLYTWVIGPKYSRGCEVKDIRAYNMIGFEGIAKEIKVYPKIGKTTGFMPAFCMLRLTHFGLVNKLLQTEEGLLVRVEDIHIAN